MFGISFTELLVIFIIVLIIFGPERLPKIAKTLGSAYGEFSRKTNEIKKEFNDAIDITSTEIPPKDSQDKKD